MSQGLDRGILSNNMGYEALKKGKLNQAIVLLKQSVEYCKSVDDWEGEITALSNLSEALFKKWADRASPMPDLHASLSSGLFADGMQCVVRVFELCIAHQDLRDAGIALQDLIIRLERHAGLSQEEAMSVSTQLINEHVGPLLMQNNIWELPGPGGFPILRLDKKPPSG